MCSKYLVKFTILGGLLSFSKVSMNLYIIKFLDYNQLSFNKVYSIKNPDAIVRQKRVVSLWMRGLRNHFINLISY